MRVILTGASGFIGRNVLLRLPRDWSVVAVYNSAADFADFVAQTTPRGRVTPVRCDLCDPDAVARVATAAGHADATLYLAANGDPAASVERPRWDLESNTLALVTFIEHCPSTRFVFASSGAVYDGAIGPVTPSTPLTPRLPYAISKLASEHYVRSFAERQRSIEQYANVRFFGAFGPYEAERKITTRFVRAVLNGDAEFTIRGSGDNLIDFMHIDDAVRGLVALVATAGPSCTVDFASGAPVSINEVVDAMARALDVSMRVRHSGVTDEFIQFRTVDTTMRDRFHIEPSVGFADGIRHLARHLGDGSDGSGQRLRLVARGNA